MAKAKEEIVNELANLLEEAGADFNEFLAQAKEQKETLVIVFDNDVINPPYDGWKLESDNNKKPVGTIRFKLAPVLKDGKKSISGNEMVNRAKEMGADWCQQVGEKLLANQDKIPKSWRKYYIVLPGTVWVGSGGLRKVACLSWYGERWVLSFGWLGHDWSERGRFLLPCE